MIPLGHKMSLEKAQSIVATSPSAVESEEPIDRAESIKCNGTFTEDVSQPLSTPCHSPVGATEESDWSSSTTHESPLSEATRVKGAQGGSASHNGVGAKESSPAAVPLDLSTGQASSLSDPPESLVERKTPSAAASNDQPQTSWSFEEQFKQLYELSDDVRRKEFLDDLFSFMQRRGTPVTRIPIMAKQVLDLYGLYRLVVNRGGLVEVINKKLWREITKGLHLPQSITSAAFTLRTQYMRYLYAYECEREKLSSSLELKAAIDGNRREGRRSSFNPFTQVSPSLIGRHLNDEEPLPSPNIQCSLGAHGALASVFRDQALAFEANRQKFNRSPRLFNENSTRNTGSGRTSANSTDSECSVNQSFSNASSRPNNETAFAASTNGQEPLLNTLAMPTAHIRVSNRAMAGDSQMTIENSLVVSMEINGTMYQGVLFAQAAGISQRSVGGT